MEILVKPLWPGAKLPTKNKPTDAGFDLYSVEPVTLERPNVQYAVRTGVAMAIPDGYYGRVAPRSGLAVKYGVDVLAGVVDSGYRGEIIVILTRCASDDGFEEALTFPIGSKIAQLIIERVDDCQMVEAENLPTSDRGMNGFGSSGV